MVSYSLFLADFIQHLWVVTCEPIFTASISTVIFVSDSSGCVHCNFRYSLFRHLRQLHVLWSRFVKVPRFVLLHFSKHVSTIPLVTLESMDLCMLASEYN